MITARFFVSLTRAHSNSSEDNVQNSNNDDELAKEIKDLGKIIAREENTRAIIQKANLKFEEKACDPHWLVHQCNAPGQNMTDLMSSIEFENTRAVYSDNAFQQWFCGLQVPLIHYDEIRGKDIVNPLGRGNTGSVYSAMWKGQKVAIKDFQERSALYHELDVINSAGYHPNIVRVLGVTR